MYVTLDTFGNESHEILSYDAYHSNDQSTKKFWIYEAETTILLFSIV